MERIPGVKIYNCYGQTELAPCHTLFKSQDALTKLGSAGMAGLHMETRIEDEFGKEIIDTCRNAPLANFKIPKRVVIVDTLPKTPTGKILKRTMGESYQGIFI